MSRPQTIIIVDDDASMGLALQRLLSAAGWPSIVFQKGEDLFASVEVERAAAFVFDIKLPGLTGLELARQLTQKGIRVPFVFITSHDRPEYRAEAERLGAAGYFLKPFSGKELIDAFAPFLRNAAGESTHDLPSF
jgi:FixJ family two-component response regulator